MTSALQTISIRIGKAINLPKFFYQELPLPKLLEEPIKLSAFLNSNSVKKKSQPKREAPKLNQLTKLTEIHGIVATGQQTKYSIQNQDFALLPGTWLIGDLDCGVKARVKGKINEQEILQASSVVVLE